MDKKFYVIKSQVATAETNTQAFPSWFAVIFDQKHFWEGVYVAGKLKYEYATGLFDENKKLPGSHEELTEKEFLTLMGRRAIAIRHFIEAYTNFLMEKHRVR
jgi:hypothetical protein